MTESQATGPNDFDLVSSVASDTHHSFTALTTMVHPFSALLLLLAPAALAAHLPRAAVDPNSPSSIPPATAGSILTPETDDFINSVLKTWKSPGVAVAIVQMDGDGQWKVSQVDGESRSLDPHGASPPSRPRPTDPCSLVSLRQVESKGYGIENHEGKPMTGDVSRSP